MWCAAYGGADRRAGGRADGCLRAGKDDGFIPKMMDLHYMMMEFILNDDGVYMLSNDGCLRAGGAAVRCEAREASPTGPGCDGAQKTKRGGKSTQAIHLCSCQTRHPRLTGSTLTISPE